MAPRNLLYTSFFSVKNLILCGTHTSSECLSRSQFFPQFAYFCVNKVFFFLTALCMGDMKYLHFPLCFSVIKFSYIYAQWNHFLKRLSLHVYPSSIVASPSTCYICYNEWTALTHHYHPESILYLRVHSWCAFNGFCRICNDVYLPL